MCPIRRLVTMSFLTLLALLSACAQNDSTASGPAAPEASAGELEGTRWRLVKIMSMDDRTWEPDDEAGYTLEFGPDGAMSVRADCNRGSGTWTSESPGQLRFGVIAATMAACPPGSLHDRYMMQFEWIRSYVLSDGRLYLATMADGAIIEFAPQD